VDWGRLGTFPPKNVMPFCSSLIIEEIVLLSLLREVSCRINYSRILDEASLVMINELKVNELFIYTDMHN